VFYGDSIVAGHHINDYGASFRDTRGKSWPFLLFSLLGNPHNWGINMGVSSILLSNIVAMATNRVDSFVGYAPAGQNVCVLAAGINDIATGYTANDTWGFTTNYLSNRRTAGWKTCIVDLIPLQSLTAGQETERLLYNGLVLSNWTAWADAYAPVSTNNWLPGGSYATNYQSDATHPNAAGRALMAATALGSILPLLH